MLAVQVNWQCERPLAPLRAQVKIRYRAEPAPATVTPWPDERVRIDFDYPLRDITPGQGAVFYDGDWLLGGGIIQRL